MPPVLPSAFCPDATPQEQAVFRERARSLAQALESQEQDEMPPLAVVRLGEELFGIDLQAIREFAELRSVTPVPCCPAHIVGQMNLRGDLITLLDIAGALGLPPTPGKANRKVVVVNSAELGAGVLVDEVLDVLSLRAADVSPAPASARAPGQEYLRGATPYGDADAEPARFARAAEAGKSDCERKPMTNLRNWKIRTKLVLMVVAFVTALLSYASVSYNTRQQLQIDGPYFDRIMRTRQLLADIAPSPLYLGEAYLIAWQVVSAPDGAQRDALIQKLRVLRQSYDTNHALWQKTLTANPDEAMKQALLVKAHDPAVRFFETAEKAFLPAVLAGDRNKAAAAAERRYAARL